jgi:hypothetical protein
MLAMNYSTEIRSIMSQAYRLNAEIDAHRKANGHDGEYRRLFRRREDLRARRFAQAGRARIRRPQRLALDRTSFSRSHAGAWWNARGET